MYLKFVAGISSLALLFFAPVRADAAMSCDRVGAKSELHYGSQVNGPTVRICGEYWMKFAPKPTPKPTGPPKVYPKSFVVRPLAPLAFRDGADYLNPGEVVNFWQNAVPHSRDNVLMGFRAEVRFRPIKVSWSFSDGVIVQTKTATHSFSKIGNHWARATVTYSVKYRFIGGTDWIREPRTITFTSSPVPVPVRVIKVRRLTNKVILVRADCLARPRAPGCLLSDISQPSFIN